MKILILDGDDLVQKIELKDKFVFVICEDGRVYHVDSSNSQMWRSEKPYKNLGKRHREIVKKEVK